MEPNVVGPLQLNTDFISSSKELNAQVSLHWAYDIVMKIKEEESIVQKYEFEFIYISIINTNLFKTFLVVN